MKIEEAIIYVMVKRNGGMTTDQIADAINRHGLHLRKDGQPVTSKQVYATICRFPEMFTKEAGRIMLMIRRNDMTIDTTNMCSHLQKKLFEPEGVYYPIWQAMQDDETLTAVVRSRQLHIYRNGKKILVLAGKAQPKVIREDKLNELITQ